MEKKTIKTVQDTDTSSFEQSVNELLNEGYSIISSGAVPDNVMDISYVKFYAILQKVEFENNFSFEKNTL